MVILIVVKKRMTTPITNCVFYIIERGPTVEDMLEVEYHFMNLSSEVLNWREQFT